MDDWVVPGRPGAHRRTLADELVRVRKPQVKGSSPFVGSVGIPSEYEKAAPALARAGSTDVSRQPTARARAPVKVMSFTVYLTMTS